MEKRSTREIAEEMLKIRLSQIIVNEEYKAGKFKIPIHLALGHEAIAIAVSHVLQDGDKLVLSHRNIAYNLARLGKLRPILDEYLLKPTGLAQGRLGSMNLINPPRGIIYSSSILGNNFPVSAGIAMAEKITDRRGVTFVLGGDGSVEEGSFYESLTIMKTLGLRVVVIIENNEWSMSTRIHERRCPIDLEKLTSSVGIPYLKLAGNRVEGYLKAFKHTREKVFQDENPICVEVLVQTLGDWRGQKTPECPEGKYINYHAGPSPSVDITKHFPGGILRENEQDPVFVISQEIGRKRLIEMSHRVMKNLQEELA